MTNMEATIQAVNKLKEQLLASEEPKTPWLGAAISGLSMVADNLRWHAEATAKTLDHGTTGPQNN